MTTVHYQQPGFMAMPETDGHGDTCGPDVMLDYAHLSHGDELTIANVDALRQELINKGLFDHGMTMGQIVEGMHLLYGVTALSYTPWGQVNQTTLRSDLQRACAAKQAVMLETSEASNLPGNQTDPWVNNHFIIAWGLDSTQGYWCGNGDTLLALGTTSPVSPVWYSWGNLASASIQSYAIFPAVESNAMPITITHDAHGLVTGAYDNTDPSKKLGPGMALMVSNKNQTNLSIENTETYYGPRSVAVLFAPDGGTPQTLTYSPQWNVEEFGGDDLAVIVSGLMNQGAAPHIEAITETLHASADPAGAATDIESFIAPLLDALKKLSS